MGKGQPAFGSGRRSDRTPPRPIPRPGLLSRLDAAEGLVLLIAGPGAGKSTLLDAWAATHTGVVIDLPEDGPREWEPVAGPLAIDGVTPADAPALSRLSSRRAVVAAATSDPGVAPATRITAKDLAFAVDETYQVLSGALADAESADEIAPDLHLLTHGWPSLVALAGAWLAQYPATERRDRLRGLARIDEPLPDYLLPAVLAALPAADRDLLRRLTQLPPVDARLADRLDITEDLAAVPPFVQPLARRPGWYTIPDAWRPALARELPLPADEIAALLSAYRSAM
ncbi:MAG TPA: hypothetical protein VL738_34480 [Dactylosporangium sp.]|nr:hypothetical protein [Dactylosporangium sp.]